MNKFLKVMFVLVCIVVLILLAGVGYVALNGRGILLAEIEKNLGVKANVYSVRVAFPASLVIENLDIEDRIKVERALVSPNFFGMLKGDIVLNALVLDKPFFKVTRNSDDSFDFGIPMDKEEPAVEAPAAVPSAQPDTAQKAKVTAKKFYLNTLKVRGGNIEFTDKAVSAEEPVKFLFSNIDIDVAHPNIFNFFRVQFKGYSELLSAHDERIAGVDISGWADFLAKDMDAKLALSGAQLIYLEPYGKKFFKKELTSGEMAFEAILKSVNNDLKADCHVEINNVGFKDMEAPPSAEGGVDPEDMTAMVFNSILNSKRKVVFDFSTYTKMDRPRFEKIKIKGVFLQPKAEDFFSAASGKSTEDLKKIGEQFEDIGKEFKRMFKEKK